MTTKNVKKIETGAKKENAIPNINRSDNMNFILFILAFIYTLHHPFSLRLCSALAPYIQIVNAENEL